MRVSIVTNAYNQGHYLAEAMSSVLSQDWDDLEYIVIDPGSTDNTPEIIKGFQEKYPGRIVHVTERDNGPADGLNKGFARSTGELFSYLNADDVYLPGCIRAAVAVAEKHPDAGAIYADGFMADAQGRVTKRVVSTAFSPKQFVYGGCLVLQQSTFYRADAFRAVKGFNVDNRTSWDAEILLDMAMRGMRLVHTPGYWSIFRIHGESITGSQRLAEESKRNHDRFFRTVMGRDKDSADRWKRTLVKGITSLTELRSTSAKLQDRIMPPRLDISTSVRPSSAG